MKIWLKLVVMISLMVGIAGAGMNLWAMALQRDAAMDHAVDYSESAYRLTLAGLTTLMVTGTMEYRAVYLSQILDTGSLRDLKVIRGENVSNQYGEGFSIELQSGSIEDEVIRS